MTQHQISKLFFASSLLFISACFAGAPTTPLPGVECNDTSLLCADGQVCLDSQCFDICSGPNDCTQIQACLGGVCRDFVGICDSETPCPEGWFCSDNVCERDNTMGDACSDSSDCSAGYCVDGVCCESACDSTCTSCIQTHTNQSDGICAPILEGFDPKEECDIAQGCDGSGACHSGDILGIECSDSDSCDSGFCVDGVCCESLCEESCMACSDDKTNIHSGFCAPITIGTDPDLECNFAQGCNG
ncbi:hypothetical protein KAI87_17140, partial [Myxococcota bacterium]|nr:hypothetical protein [Myxococcota bacterium]